MKILVHMISDDGRILAIVQQDFELKPHPDFDGEWLAIGDDRWPIADGGTKEEVLAEILSLLGGRLGKLLEE